MNKTDNLYNVLRGLENNMSKLRNESRCLDYEIMKIFDKRIYAERMGKRIQDEEMHYDCRCIEMANDIIAKNERNIRFQHDLHAKLLSTYNELYSADLRHILGLS